LIVGYNAIWIIGGVAVPLNPIAHRTELEHHLADAAVSLVVAARGSRGEAAAGRLKLPYLDLESFAAMAELEPAAFAACRAEEDGAVLLYTGGTTGTPKGALLTHRNLVANTIQFAEWYAFEAGAETSLSAIPMFHSGGMSGVMNVPLYAGATL